MSSVLKGMPGLLNVPVFQSSVAKMLSPVLRNLGTRRKGKNTQTPKTVLCGVEAQRITETGSHHHAGHVLIQLPMSQG